MTIYVFPGQGSQFKGMGGDLFGEFKEITNKADQILGYSIKDLCLKDPKHQLNNTQFTQPALYTVNALSYLKKVISKRENFHGRLDIFIYHFSLGTGTKYHYSGAASVPGWGYCSNAGCRRQNNKCLDT